MGLEQRRPTPTGTGGPIAPLSYVIAERARREMQGDDLRQPRPSTVDLAKQPGLLYRLHAILND